MLVIANAKRVEKMQIKNMDILDVQEGVIVHQVNCKKVMGAGLALQIKKKYPKHYADFMSREPKLGTAFGTQIRENLFVCGVYGQNTYGRGRCQTNYAALEKALKMVAKSAARHNLQVYIPYGIGCGLAGGDWNVVRDIIERTVSTAIIAKK